MNEFNIQMNREQLELIKVAMQAYLDCLDGDELQEAELITGMADYTLNTDSSERIELFGWNL